jgi:hypothetical protein
LVGYYASNFAGSAYTPILNQCTLLHSDPKVNPWIRKNGDFSLTVSSGFDRDGTPYGLPYGSCPRLVVAYIITQDHQLVEKWLRNHGKVPPWVVKQEDFT